MVTEVGLRKIDADTHISLPVDYNDLRDLLPRTQASQAKEMMWRETQRFMDPNGVRASVGSESRGAARGSGGVDGNPDNIEFRLQQMERLGFDMQVLVAQTALPTVLRSASIFGAPKPLWLRTALAQLYNDSAAKLQSEYPDKFIGLMTVPWDDIDASISLMEQGKAQGLRAVTLQGSWLDQNLDAPELYPFWEAVNSLDIACIMHDTPQPCGGNLVDHNTPYPMVGHERYHRLHIGTYLGFGLDYTVACAALSLGGVLDDFPNLRFLFFEAGATWMTYAMMGADRSFYIEPACSRTKNLPSDLIKKHCFTAVENLEPLDQLVEAYGADNFIIGTDYPHPEFQRLPNAPGDVTNSTRITDEDKAKILGGNMVRALKLD